MAGRADEQEATRVRRQRIFVGAGAVVLLGLVGFQLPGLLSSGGSKKAAQSTVPPPAVPVAKADVARGASPTAEPGVPRALTRLAERDLFVAQVASGPTSSGGTPIIFPKAPAVRAKDFVVKDPFIAQVVIPAAPVAPPAGTVTTPFPDQTTIPQKTDNVGTSIVILRTIDGTGQASQKEAARAVVAAKNAGLKDVVANNTLGPRKGPGAHFTIFTGPYTTSSGLQAELTRAHRNGYPGAYSLRVTGTPIGGF